LSRGLELWLCAGIVGLLFYGLAHARMRSKTAARASLPDVAQAEQQQTPAGRLNRESLREKSPREIYFEKALAAIQAEEESGQRDIMLAALEGQIPVADIQTTLNALQNLAPDSLADEFSQRLLRRWTRRDGHAAAAWAEQIPTGPMRNEALSVVAIEWANTALGDAEAWARQLPDDAERAAALFAVADEAVRTEPVEALRLVVELPADPRREELIRHAATEWAAQDPTGAVAWAEQIPDAALRVKVLAGEAVSWAEQNPEAAATLAVEKLPPGRLQEDAVISIVQRWAQQQPEVAIAWVEQFPETPLRTLAMAVIREQSGAIVR
jgi:hypothetical protein